MGRIKKVKDAVKTKLESMVGAVGLGLVFLNNHESSELYPGADDHVEQALTINAKEAKETEIIKPFPSSPQEILFNILFLNGVCIIEKEKITAWDLEKMDIDISFDYGNVGDFDEQFKKLRVELFEEKNHVKLIRHPLVKRTLDNMIEYGLLDFFVENEMKTKREDDHEKSRDQIFDELRLLYNGSQEQTIFSSRDKVFYSKNTSPYRDVKCKIQDVNAVTPSEEFCLTVYHLLFSKKYRSPKKSKGVLNENLEEIVIKIRDNNKIKEFLENNMKAPEEPSPASIYNYLNRFVQYKTEILKRMAKYTRKADNFFKKLSDNLYGVKTEKRKIENLSVVSESSCLPENWADNRNCGCCTLGPHGEHKYVALDAELDPHVGVLRLVGDVKHPYLGMRSENLGIAYVFQCKTEKDELVWLVDTVDSGIRKEEIEQDWREIFYKGILKAAKYPELKEKPTKLYFNMHVRNADNELFNEYVEKMKKSKYVEIEKIGADSALVAAGIRHGHYMDTFYDGEVKDSQWIHDCKGKAKVVEIDLRN